MSKGKYRYGYGIKTRRDREIRQQQHEIIDANREPMSEIVEDTASSAEVSDNANWIPDDKRKWYVLDTNLILSCVDVIYDPDDENWRPPLNFRPNLDNAHLIIPQKVFDELDHMKSGHTANRITASRALRCLKRFFQNSGRTMDEIMSLKHPIPTGWKNQTISLLPLHRDFAKNLPYVPDFSDNDGWIALTALAATMVREGLPVDGIATCEMLKRSNARNDVILLTKDNGLMSKADTYAVRTRTYSFDERPEFCGVRELTVPADLFAKFYYSGREEEDYVTGAEFREAMPNELPLVANEYIVMTAKDDVYPRGYFASNVLFANVARYNKKNDKLYPLRYAKREGATPPNAGIAAYYDAMNDPSINVIVATGRAGTGKTYQIMAHSIRALDDGLYAQAVLIVDSENGVGTLPGNLERKMAPMVAFAKDAIRSYIAKKPEFRKKRELLRQYGDNNTVKTGRDAGYRQPDFSYIDEDYYYDAPMSEPMDRFGGQHSKKKKCKNSQNGTQNTQKPAEAMKTYQQQLDDETEYFFERHFKVVPYAQTRGRTFEDSIIIIDEAQRIYIDDMETFITRPGDGSLLVVCGDVNQIKFNSPEKRLKNGLVFARRIYHDAENCANIHLTEQMRNESVDVANRNYDALMAELYALDT